MQKKFKWYQNDIGYDIIKLLLCHFDVNFMLWWHLNDVMYNIYLIVCGFDVRMTSKWPFVNFTDGGPGESSKLQMHKAVYVSLPYRVPNFLISEVWIRLPYYSCFGAKLSQKAPLLILTKWCALLGHQFSTLTASVRQSGMQCAATSGQQWVW